MTKNNDDVLKEFEAYKKANHPSVNEQRGWLLRNLKRFDQETRNKILEEVIPDLMLEVRDGSNEKVAQELQVKELEVERFTEAIRRAQEQQDDDVALSQSQSEDGKQYRILGFALLALASLILISSAIGLYFAFLMFSFVAAGGAALLGIIAFAQLERGSMPPKPRAILPSFHQNERFYSNLKDMTEVLCIIEIFYEHTVEVPHTLVRIKNQIQRRLQEFLPEQTELPAHPLVAIDKQIQPDVNVLRKQLRLERLTFRTIKVQTPPIATKPVQEAFFEADRQ